MPGFTKFPLVTGALLALTAGVAHADMVIATVGPMTGQYAIFGDQMKRGAEMAVKDLNAKGGVARPAAQARGRRRRLRPQAGGRGRQPVRQQGRGVRRRALLLRLLDPAPRRSTTKKGVLQISPGLDQPQADRAGLRQRVPGLRPRRPVQGTFAGNYVVDNQRRHQGRGRSTTRPPTARAWPTSSRSSSTSAALKETDVRGDHRRRQGLHRPDHQDEGSRRRPDLSRRLPHRGRPDHAPGPRAGPRRRR